ncbi:hypothetical protein [Cylindrospermopsis curvispora]|uniref:Uncharacterized protein n=1 Tax=Cylindrospermopsis curvispora GIHE-G1 TaxID=2666332 RepID=A0A7H0F2H2_9CYAN|nr:hypothetical protein [Cylindrospermopsis curvispora]QNP30238.1 hypothetical protein IAR63_04000 [Cylindrospermopsis curvispora GIHE-G1]
MSAKIIALAISSLAISGCGLENSSNSPGEGQKPPASFQLTNPVVPAKIVPVVKSNNIQVTPSTTQNSSARPLPKARRDPFGEIVRVPQKISTLPSVVMSTNASPNPPKKPVVIKGQNSVKPLLPKVPDTKLAQDILVSGVILVDKQARAIIALPEDPTGRYVEAGEKLPNGILIKRIEINQCDNPVVVLEQFGVEIKKVVKGEFPEDGNELC